jgi:SAM-dependent methyltransferase
MSAELETLYANRFDPGERAWKDEVWTILCRKVFARWISKDATVLDLGAGYCEFVNHVEARRRIAVDLNPETARVAAHGVEVRAVSATELGFLADGEVDVVFSSNFLEHLANKDEVAKLLNEAHRVLKPGGRIILMGPNIRYLPGQYWDYFDHHVPLSDKSVQEALLQRGFSVDHLEAKFLPYSVKGSKVRWRWVVEAYLSLRPLSSALFGKQFLVSATRRR